MLLLSTSDTDLITARASGAGYRWANPSRLIDGELADLLDGADAVVVRILGGYRAWQEGIDTVVAAGVPVVVVSGEQAPDADLMERSTVPAGIAMQTHIYLAQGGVENLRQLHAFLSDTLVMTGYGFSPPAPMPSWGLLDPPCEGCEGCGVQRDGEPDDACGPHGDAGAGGQIEGRAAGAHPPQQPTPFADGQRAGRRNQRCAQRTPPAL